MRRPWKQSRRGAQALEFALVLPVLLALLTGVIDYGFYFFQQHSVVASVRDGARLASALSCTDFAVADIELLAEERTSNALTSAGVDHAASEVTATVGYDIALSASTGEDVVVVTVEADIGHGLIIGLVPGPSSLASTLVMRMEDQDCSP